MITTIQLNENVKNALNQMKETKRESYEEVIVKMMHLIEKQKREQEELLIEGCKAMAEDSLRMNKEWEKIDSELDWEWDENED